MIPRIYRDVCLAVLLGLVHLEFLQKAHLGCVN